MPDKKSNYSGPSIIVRNLNKGPESFFGNVDLTSMSLDDLWKLREAVVAKKIAAEIIALDQYLLRLTAKADIFRRGSQKPSNAERRRYPPVLPKYRNPTQPSETWAGRGRKPEWLTAQLS
jgi:DNA-binding protein H-NS